MLKWKAKFKLRFQFGPNLIKRKTETYPNWAIKRLTLMKENHKKIKLPQNIGRKILIKK